MSKEILLGLIEKFAMDINKVDELCYEFYSMFKDFAVSIAIERPTCSRIVILGKDFEIRLYISPSGEGTLAMFIRMFIDIWSNFVIAFEDIKKILIPVIKTLLSIAKICDDPIIILRDNITIHFKSIANLIEFLRESGMAIEYTDRKIFNDLEIFVIRGFCIGRNLKKYQVTFSVLTNEKIEAGITIESKTKLDVICNDTMLFSFIKELYDFLLDLEKILHEKAVDSR